MPPRVRLGRTHGRSNTPRHEIQAGADLSPSQPALRRSHKFTALTEFCKRLRGINSREQGTIREFRAKSDPLTAMHPLASKGLLIRRRLLQYYSKRIIR